MARGRGPLRRARPGGRRSTRDVAAPSVEAGALDSSRAAADGDWVVLQTAGRATWRPQGSVRWLALANAQVLPAGSEVETGPAGDLILVLGGDRLVVGTEQPPGSARPRSRRGSAPAGRARPPAGRCQVPPRARRRGPHAPAQLGHQGHQHRGRGRRRAEQRARARRPDHGDHAWRGAGGPRSRRGPAPAGGARLRARAGWGLPICRRGSIAGRRCAGICRRRQRPRPPPRRRLRGRSGRPRRRRPWSRSSRPRCVSASSAPRPTASRRDGWLDDQTSLLTILLIAAGGLMILVVPGMVLGQSLRQQWRDRAGAKGRRRRGLIRRVTIIPRYRPFALVALLVSTLYVSGWLESIERDLLDLRARPAEAPRLGRTGPGGDRPGQPAGAEQLALAAPLPRPGARAAARGRCAPHRVRHRFQLVVDAGGRSCARRGAGPGGPGKGGARRAPPMGPA